MLPQNSPKMVAILTSSSLEFFLIASIWQLSSGNALTLLISVVVVERLNEKLYCLQPFFLDLLHASSDSEQSSTCGNDPSVGRPALGPPKGPHRVILRNTSGAFLQNN